MIANLEALAAVARVGTITRAATELRITQSAVSKRIAALTAELGFDLIEPDGRRVKLTADGVRILDRAGPLLAELRHALSAETSAHTGVLVMGVSESILASWGPAALARARGELPELKLVVHAHRSPVAVERVRSGEYMLALCAGYADWPDLTTLPLMDEPLVLVPSGLERLRLRAGTKLPILTIEPGSATWRSMAPAIARLKRERRIELRVDQTVESFACAVQMARAGFGHALVPKGIAQAMHVPPKALVKLPAPGVSRPVSLVGRALTLSRPLVSAFCAALQSAIADDRRPG